MRKNRCVKQSKTTMLESKWAGHTRYRFWLWMVVASISCQEAAWSQQAIAVRREYQTGSIPNQMAVVRFADIPILAVPQETGDNPSVEPIETEARLPLRSVSSTTHRSGPKNDVPEKKVPSILGNTTSVTVSLNFLVLSSLSTQKAIVTFRASFDEVKSDVACGSGSQS